MYGLSGVGDEQRRWYRHVSYNIYDTVFNVQSAARISKSARGARQQVSKKRGTKQLSSPPVVKVKTLNWYMTGQKLCQE